MTLDDIWTAITAEQVRARELHPTSHVASPLQWHDRRLAILVEEVGEVATEVQTGNVAALRDELVQVAAVAVAWLRTL